MSRGAWRLAGLLTLTAAFAFVPASAGGPGPGLVHGTRLDGAEVVPNQVIVRFEPGTTRAERADAVRDQGATVAEALALPRTELVELPDGTSVEEAVAAFEADPDVAYAEPNYVYEIAAVPNDTNFAQLWGLSQASDKDIDAPEAWDLTTGSKEIVVAVIDTGVAYDHPDLAGNIWTNDDPPGGSDQDDNGFVDDTNGWDFISNDRTPLDANEHGSHVAGTIGATGNNALGVTGVNWQVSIMPLRAGNASGGLPDSAILGAIQYACANGARIVNGSFGGVGFSQAILDAITSSACANTLFVFAAGNGGVDGVGDDNDAAPQYPCSYATTRIVCVAATDQNDARASFSNYGATSVDLAAPGVAVFSTIPKFGDVETDGFEGTQAEFDARWGVASSPAGHPLWGRQSPGASGTFALSDSPSGDYSADTLTHIRSLSGADLSGRSGCSLGYSMHLATELDHDYFAISAASSFGGPYTLQTAWTGFTAPGFWRFYTELGTFDGRPNVFVRFDLLSDGSVQADGAQIDDLAFRCLTTQPAAGEYRNLNGTSMASPHVAGAAALVLSRDPALSPAQVRSILLSTVDPVAGLTVASGGRLNVGRAVAAVDVTAPDTTIDTGPSGATNDTTPTFTFSSNETATFQCRVDTGTFATCTSPHTTVTLAEGAHTFEVLATDQAGHTDATPASRSFTVDTTAPQTAIDSGPSAAINDATPTFAFSSEAGATFQCRVDSAAFAACTSPFTTAAVTDGAHTFEVRATDEAGNTDSTPASRSFTIDTTAPQTTIDSGPSGPTNVTSPSFAFSSEVGATFQCRVDTAAFAVCSSPRNTGALADGAHTFDVRAIDQAGNTDGTPAGAAFTVDTTPPDLPTIVSGPAGTVAATGATFAFSGEAGATFECGLDGAAFAACTSPAVLPGLAQGAHTFEIHATDPAGNTSAASSRAWLVDTQAPNAKITGGPSRTTKSKQATFRFSSTETGSTFRCKLDKGAWRSCKSPMTYKRLKEGSHTFQVVATDKAGNVDRTPAKKTWKIR